MSKIFYDHLLDLKKVSKHVGKVARSEDEKIELWQIVDEIVHHGVIGCILDNLPKEHHEEFLERFYESPHDEQILVFLKEKIQKDIVEIIRDAVCLLTLEITDNILPKRKKKVKK